jgi:hypothetical protein
MSNALKYPVFALFLCACSLSSAQVMDSLDATASRILNLMHERDSSFWHIKSIADTYFTANSAIDDRFAKIFARWDYFWGTRVDSSGELTTANNAVLQYAASNPTICQSGGNWSQSGPSLLNKQSSGIIISVYSPPGFPNTIYAGSNTGGLWKTTDSGQSWNCITDNLRLPALGINWIAGNPNNVNELYFGSGISTGFYENYGIGLYKSTDAGQTWNPTGLAWSPSGGGEYHENPPSSGRSKSYICPDLGKLV